MTLRRFELKGSDGKMIRGDRLDGTDRHIVFITGLLSTRWGNKSRALRQWCEEQGWSFCCYDVDQKHQAKSRQRQNPQIPQHLSSIPH